LIDEEELAELQNNFADLGFAEFIITYLSQNAEVDYSTMEVPKRSMLLCVFQLGNCILSSGNEYVTNMLIDKFIEKSVNI